jgi:hypothetical protein
MRRVALIGFGETRTQAPFGDEGVTIYGLNELYKHLPRWDEWIEIHDEASLGLTDRVGPEQVLAETRAHRAWLEQPHDGKTIWMQQRFCDGRFPAARPFPLAELGVQFGTLLGHEWRYFTSTVALMLAQMIAAGRDAAWRVTEPDQAVDWIGLYGIDLSSRPEYEHQRPCVEFFVGFARGVGITVHLAEGSAILQSDHIYGFERPVGEEGPVSRSRLQLRRQRLQQKHEELLATLHKVRGALTETERWLTVAEKARRGVRDLPRDFLDAPP